MGPRRTANLILLLLGVGFALASPFFFVSVEALGWRIPQPDMSSDYLIGLGFALGFFALLALFPFPSSEKRILMTVWAAKCLVALGLMLLYEWNYPLDAYWYFELSREKIRPVPSGTATSGTGTIINILWYFENYVIRTDSYHAQKILVSFLSFLGIYALYRGIRKHSSKVTPRLFFYVSLFPSILFWGSILGKDPVNLFGICLFYYGALSLMKVPRIHHAAAAGAGILIVYSMRPWMVPVMILPFLVLQIIKIRHFATKVALIGLTAAAGLYGLRFLGKSLSIESTEALTGAVNQLSRSWQRGGSATKVPELTSLGAILRFLPVGIFTALFRPLPGEILNLFGLVAGLENLYLLYLVFRAYRSFARRLVDEKLVYLGISFVIIWGVPYAFVSPQNLGAAVRFKLQVLPIMLITLLYLAYPGRKPEPEEGIRPPDPS